MANQSSTIAIGITINLKNLTQVGQLNTALKALKTNINNLYRQIGGTNTGLDGTSKSASGAAKSVNRLAKELNAAAIAARNQAKSDQAATRGLTSGVSNWYKQKAKLARDAATAEARATAQTIRNQQREEAALNRMAQALARRARAEREADAKAEKTLVGRLRKYEQENDALFRAGFRIQMLGNDMEALGRKGLAALSGLAQEFGDFEFMINRAAGAMSLSNNAVDGSVNLYERFQSTILDAAGALRLFNPTDVAKATYYWASTTGQQINSLGDLKTLIEAINPLMKVSALTETDYETSIKGVYSILVQYNKRLSDASDVTAELFKTAQLTAAEFPDLVNSFKMVGPVAAANNETFESMVGLFGRLADAGIRGTMSGRAFRQLFIQLVRPSDKAKTALDDLWKSTKQFGGKSYVEMVFPEGKFIGVNKYVNLLAEATANLTQQQRNSLLATITTANELPVLTALVNRQIDAMHGIADATGEAKNQSQSAQEYFKQAWDRLSSSWNGVVGAVTRGVETIRIQIGGRLAKMFTPVMEALARGLAAAREWADNPANAEVIDFFVRLVGFGAGILAVGGALTVLGGALISVVAATKVIAGSFGKLFGQIAAVGGAIGGIIGAIVRNFEYLRVAGTKIVKNLTEAFGGTSKSVNDLGGSLSDFFNVTKPIFDFLVRTFADLMVGLSSLIKMFAKNEVAMTGLTIVANALAIVLSVRMFRALMGLVPGLGFLTRGFGGLGRTITYTAIQIDRSTKSLGRVQGSIRGLSMGFKGLAGWLVGGGGIGLALAGLAGGFSLLYSKSASFRDSVDSIGRAFKDFKGDADNAIESLGEWGGRVEGDIRLSTEWLEIQKRINAARDEMNRPRLITGGVLFGGAEGDLLKAEHDLQELRERIAEVWNGIARDANEAGNSIDVSGIIQKADDFKRAFGFLTRQQAATITSTFFKAIGDGSQSSAEKIRLLTKAWYASPLLDANLKKIKLSDFIQIGLGKEGFDMAMMDQEAEGIMKNFAAAIKENGDRISPEIRESMRASMLQTLQGLKGVSPEMQERIKTMVGEAVAGGLDPESLEPPLDQSAEKTMNGIANAILDAAEGFRDFDKKVEAILKRVVKPGSQLHGLINSVMTGAIAATKGKIPPEALQLITADVQSYKDQFDNQIKLLGGIGSPAGQEFAKKMIKSFTIWMGKGIPKTTPGPVKDALYDIMVDMYGNAGYTEVPQSVHDLIYGKGKDIGKNIPKGIGDGAKPGTPESKTAFDKAHHMMTDVLKGVNPGTQPRKHGAAITGGLNTGLADNQRFVNLRVAALVAKFKTFNFGNQPYTWMSHFGQNLYDGLNEWVNPIRAQVRNLAFYIRNHFEHSVPTSGPFKGDDQWFYHMGQNLAGGLERSIPLAVRAADRFSDSVASRLQGTTENAALLGDFNSNIVNAKTIKVQVEVTSPDGSVDRLKAEQFQQALMTNDFMISLEHMVEVG